MAYYGDGLEHLYPNHAKRCLSRYLSEGWEVENRRQTEDLLAWLLEEGHEAEFQARRAGARTSSHPARDAFVADQPDLSTIRAWDLSRLASVARWSYGMGYLKEDETWSWLFRAARAAQAEFGSWEDFVANYQAGFEYWAEGPADAVALDSFRAILEGPLSQLPWQQELSERP